jgi:hypothetical protein
MERNLLSVLDLTPLPTFKKENARVRNFTEFIQAVHTQVKEKIEQSNAEYKASTNTEDDLFLKNGIWFWVVLTKEMHPHGPMKSWLIEG